MLKHKLPLFILTIILFSCNNSQIEESNSENLGVNEISFEIKNLSDEEYPENPDIGYRSTKYQNNYFQDGIIQRTKDSLIFNLQFYTKSKDTISIKSINLSEFIPTIPDAIKSDNYLSLLSCVNQEWNRNQVKFEDGEFSTTVPNIARIDVARNCLNAYLWEIIIYIEEDGKTVPYTHGWFDFPHALYAELFEIKNNKPFKIYANFLENWVDPESKKVNLSSLRTVIDTINIQFSDKSDAMYPLAAARLKKRKEIIQPVNFKTMKDLQSDSTLFATFSPPGKYNKKDPRKTELGRLNQLKEATILKVYSPISQDTLYEVSLQFQHKTNGTRTSLVIGGLDFKQFPILSNKNANDGWKHSMGIGNHTFYETYKVHNETIAKNNPYYALLMDTDGKWLDSHKVGIDGPIFHFEDEGRKFLNLWLLSFERHALVGHYALKIK